MARLRYNGLATTLGASLNDSATAVTFGAALTHSGGTAVPTIAGGDHILLSILDGSGRLSEIVQLTAYTTGATTGTILRAQEGTTAKSHTSGASVVNGLVVGEIRYDNTGSGLAATELQEAIDELAALIEAGGGGGPQEISWSGMFAGTAYTGGGTHAADLPDDTIEAGDLLLLYGYRNDSGTIPVPSGFSTMVSAGNSRHHLFYKTAVGGETSITVGNPFDYASYLTAVIKRNATSGLVMPVLLNQSGAAVALDGCTLVAHFAGSYAGVPSATSSAFLVNRGSVNSSAKITAYSQDAPSDPTQALSWSNAVTSLTVGIKRV